MSPRACLLAALAFGALACASHPAARAPEGERKPAQFVPTTPYSGGDGSTIEQAVVITAHNEDEGIHLENEWIFNKFGRFRRLSYGVATNGARRYDVINFELPDGSHHAVIFDITSFFGKLMPLHEKNP